MRDGHHKNNYKTSFMVAFYRNHAYFQKMDTTDIAMTLDGLGNGTRLDIFRLLVRAGGLTVGDIATRLELTPSTLAFHLRCLVKSGLVQQEKRGRAVICQPNLGKLRAILMVLEDECCREMETAPEQETSHGGH